MIHGQLRAWIEIDLDAIEANVRALSVHVGKAELMAVLKADACGHGAVRVAPAVLDAGASRIGLAHLDEALELREAGITCPLHLLGHLDPAGAALAVSHDLVPNVNDRALALALSAEARRQGKPVRAHIKVDTGLRRWGVAPVELPGFLDFVDGLPGIEVEGVYTHFANLDAGDIEDTRRAFAEFMASAGAAERVLGRKLMRHVANTVASVTMDDMHLDMVRPGVGLYGLYPRQPLASKVLLRPAFSLKSRIAATRRLAAGEGIGYGAIYRAGRETTVALVPVGFGDGLPATLGSRAQALVGGVEVPLIGKVSTDAVALDITACPGARVGSEVVFIGRQGGKEILAEDIADSLGIFVDPILINLGRCLPRRYVSRRDGAGRDLC